MAGAASEGVGARAEREHDERCGWPGSRLEASPAMTSEDRVVARKYR